VKKPQTLSRPTRAALQLLGLEISRARRAKHWNQAELAERAGISDATLRAVERGSSTVAIGTVFEIATILGIDLFAEPTTLPQLIERGHDRLAVLPARVRTPTVSDDF
jgi:transcriptional regulator with XRE-family HTH domain